MFFSTNIQNSLLDRSHVSVRTFQKITPDSCLNSTGSLVTPFKVCAHEHAGPVLEAAVYILAKNMASASPFQDKLVCRVFQTLG